MEERRENIEAVESGGVTGEPEELRGRLRGKENTIRELHGELAKSRLEADESRAASESAEGRIEALERERTSLLERVDTLEDELSERRHSREGSNRRTEFLSREVERLTEEVSHRDHLLKMSEEEMEGLASQSRSLVSRKEGALEDALRRVTGLERDLEEREVRLMELEASLDESRMKLEEERSERERLSEPANRVRAGLEVFNESRHRETVMTLSRTLGQPRVHVGLGRGEEPPAILEFTWRGVSWRHFAANPGLAVEEPRVYVTSSGEDLSGVDERPPNAHVGPGGRILLGL